MQEELLRIWAQARKTVLFITHQIDEAIYLADRVVVFSGRPGKVKDSIAVDIERPRPLGVKRQPRFHAHRRSHLGPDRRGRERQDRRATTLSRHARA